MGYEVARFVDEVDEELICAVCRHVLEAPVQIRQCEHCFCSSCINEWLKHQQVCPVDRNPVSPMDDLIQPPRILRNLLTRLRITCDNRDFGCDAVVKLDCLQSHCDQCQHNPKRPVPCEKGCGLVVPLDEVVQHNCVRELHRLLKAETGRVEKLTSRVEELEMQLGVHHQDILVLKEIIRTKVCSGVSNPDETEKAIQTVRWLSSLKPARVKRWGGMISTPDTVLQAIIKRALSDSGCPSFLLNELMANAHERRWPTGLSTLETRQLNRRRYEQYVTKRVPGKQAIIIMASENEHMGESMVVSPGLVMIFAHGVE